MKEKRLESFVEFTFKKWYFWLLIILSIFGMQSLILPFITWLIVFGILYLIYRGAAYFRK